MHGSTHLLLIQDLSKLHSLLVIHSGRQYGGFPTKPLKQVQDDVSPTSRHKAFGPHGDGMQGVFVGGFTSKKIIFYNLYKNICFIITIGYQYMGFRIYFYLRCISKQRLNGSPVSPLRQ